MPETKQTHWWLSQMSEPYEECGIPLPMVAAPDSMTDEIFIKHMNNRHTEDLKLNGEGLIDMRTSWPDQIYTYRAFHRRVHETSASSLNHIHNEETE